MLDMRGVSNAKARAALLLGGAVFIGSHLLSHFASSGKYEKLVSGDIRSPRFVAPGVEYVEVDARKCLPDDICPGVTEIFNLAAVHTAPEHEDWEYFWTSVLGAIHGSDYAYRSGPRNVIFTSLISVYRESDVHEPSKVTYLVNQIGMV
jgi:GlcNAc-P-P-Und epimerase